MMEDSDISLDIPADLFPADSPVAGAVNPVDVPAKHPRLEDSDDNNGMPDLVTGKAAIRPSDSFLTFLSDS